MHKTYVSTDFKIFSHEIFTYELMTVTYESDYNINVYLYIVSYKVIRICKIHECKTF